jgi:hypothetical protein
MRGVVWLNLLSLSRFVNDTAPWLYFSLVAVKSGMPSLQPNTTYYFNMINTNCPSGRYLRHADVFGETERQVIRD